MPTSDPVEGALEAITAGARARYVESSVLDFKTVGRSVPDTLRALAETAACFANADGGTVVVGVADDMGGPDAIVGCDLDPVQTQRRIYELTDPKLVTDVKRVSRVGRRILIISTPRSPDVHAVGGRSTERIGTACEPMSTARIAAVVDERRGQDWSAETSDIHSSTADPVAIGAARSLLERSSDTRRRAHAGKSEADLLRTLGVVTERGLLTNAGALLFTNQLSNRHQVRYVYRRTPAGQLVTNETLSAPLLPALVRALELIDARSDRTPLNLPGGQQLQLADLPEAAVREAIMNAVMHRDHRRPEAVQVEHTATRLRVWSPGSFVSGVGVSNVLTTLPRSRNPLLATALRTLNLAENAGTGVDRMYVEMARIGHQPPSFVADAEHVEVTLLGGAPNTTVARFAASLPAGEADDADTMLVLFTLLTNRTVTAEDVVTTLQKDQAETRAVLDRLGSEPVNLIEPTRETARRASPKYRLREDAVAALGAALPYRRRTVDESDRKIIGLVREVGEINGRMVRLLLDHNTPSASRVLGDLVDRGILRKTSTAQRGPSVTYGPGPNFPKPPRTRPRPARSPTPPVEESES